MSAFANSNTGVLNGKAIQGVRQTLEQTLYIEWNTVYS